MDHEDTYSNDDLFNITSWGADLSFRELNTMYKEKELIKPELQRNYVWTKFEASRFIESILLGLPVPSIFLAEESNNTKLIIDGYQRIMTMYDYIERNIFGKEGGVFKLSNTDKINTRWRNKAFTELSIDDQRKLKSASIHAIIFVQTKPSNDDTSMFQIFERINTSGRSLNPQEIRNCVCQGTLNSLLLELNKNQQWRTLYGKEKEESRMQDLECILRFLAMREKKFLSHKKKQIVLKQHLDQFMSFNRNTEGKELRDSFETVIDFVYLNFGVSAFQNVDVAGKTVKKFNPTIFETVMLSSNDYIQKGKGRKHKLPQEYQACRKKLLMNADFKKVSRIRTTDVENIIARQKLAQEIIFE